jgi:hypothetical protein
MGRTENEGAAVQPDPVGGYHICVYMHARVSGRRWRKCGVGWGVTHRTGRGGPRRSRVGEYTLRKRQSSLTSTRGTRPITPWMLPPGQMADGASASQVTGAQAGYARGDAKRRSPIGARAYGIPRKARAVALAPTVRTSPRIAPCVVVTTSYVCAAAAAASAATTTDPTDAIHTIISPALQRQTLETAPNRDTLGIAATSTWTRRCRCLPHRTTGAARGAHAPPTPTHAHRRKCTQSECPHRHTCTHTLTVPSHRRTRTQAPTIADRPTDACTRAGRQQPPTRGV